MEHLFEKSYQKIGGRSKTNKQNILRAVYDSKAYVSFASIYSPQPNNQ